MSTTRPLYARVLVFLPIRSKTSPLFDYTIPAALTGKVEVGMLVVVPFRKSLLPGIVMTLVEVPAVSETRPLREILVDEPVLTVELLDLAHWMSRETLAPLHKCVQAMLPPGLRPKVDMIFEPQVLTLPEGLPQEPAILLRLLLSQGPLRATQVRTRLRRIDWRRASTWLKKRDLILVKRVLRLPRAQPKLVRTASLRLPRKHWEQRLKGLKSLDIYQAVLAFLEQEPEPVPVNVIEAETTAQSYHLKMLEKRGLIDSGSQEVVRDPLADVIFTPDSAPALTPDQQSAWEILNGYQEQEEPPPPVLLMGVTGSGKTELYLRATQYVLEHDQQALILIPEISLTPQTVRRFAVRFPGKVGLWHSGMSDGQRYDTWRRARDGQLSVVVGARSALFMPFPKLGLVVLDEEEDPSYKQRRQPRYHTRDVAEALARQRGALLILGSATPTLESFHRAQQGYYRLVALSQRILGHRRRISDWQHYLHLSTSRYRPLDPSGQVCTVGLPPVSIVDMREELKAGNRSIFSFALQDAVDVALEQDEQAIFFLNRRGTATYVFCRDCGWVAQCPRCDVPLTHHAGLEALLCHHCGHQEIMAPKCPVCGSSRVRAFGLGTEGLEAKVHEQWPDAIALRWDRDTARSHTAHLAIMERFSRREASILIGTQMIARGLDLPAVTVVGIISADTGLHLPDFRAGERAFQILTQVAGRAGRGILGGRVILQTYHPGHYAIQRAAVHDYEGFSRSELDFRRTASYPPFIRLARLVYQHPNGSRAKEAAESLAELLREALHDQQLPATDLIGPAPAFFARVRGRYCWHIILRHINPPAFLRDFPIPAGWQIDIDPVDVL